MKPEKRIEKFLRRIEVIPDAEKKGLGLEELVEVRNRTQKPTSANGQPPIRRSIMNRQIWKIAASLVVAATAIGVIGILNDSGQKAYAFEQTVAAMQKTRTLHVRTYFGTPTTPHDEFWAEFDSRGNVRRLRQLDLWAKEDNPVLVLRWSRLEHQFRPYRTKPISEKGNAGLHLIGMDYDENRDIALLQEFDPATIVNRWDDHIKQGRATIKVDDTSDPEGNIIVKITHDHFDALRVFTVDPETALVLRMDEYRLRELDDDGKEYTKYLSGIEVLEYNKPLDESLFDWHEQAEAGDYMTFDQCENPVGMRQGDLTAKETAFEVVRRALHAWAADDYETAGTLFGAAPEEFLATYRKHLKPVDASDIIIGEPVAVPIDGYDDGERMPCNTCGHGIASFNVACTYTVEQKGELKEIKKTYKVVLEQAWDWDRDRWYIEPRWM